MIYSWKPVKLFILILSHFCDVVLNLAKNRALSLPLHQWIGPASRFRTIKDQSHYVLVTCFALHRPPARLLWPLRDIASRGSHRPQAGCRLSGDVGLRLALCARPREAGCVEWCVCSLFITYGWKLRMSHYFKGPVKMFLLHCDRFWVCRSGVFNMLNRNNTR